MNYCYFFSGNGDFSWETFLSTSAYWSVFATSLVRLMLKIILNVNFVRNLSYWLYYSTDHLCLLFCIAIDHKNGQKHKLEGGRLKEWLKSQSESCGLCFVKWDSSSWYESTVFVLLVGAKGSTLLKCRKQVKETNWCVSELWVVFWICLLHMDFEWIQLYLSCCNS